MFAAGLAGFGLFSLLCAAAPSVELLVAARALQGVAGALLGGPSPRSASRTLAGGGAPRPDAPGTFEASASG